MQERTFFFPAQRASFESFQSVLGPIAYIHPFDLDNHRKQNHTDTRKSDIEQPWSSLHHQAPTWIPVLDPCICIRQSQL